MNWTPENIEPKAIRTFAQWVRLTGITLGTLIEWRKRGLLKVMDGNPSMTTGACLLYAIENRPRKAKGVPPPRPRKQREAA